MFRMTARLLFATLALISSAALASAQYARGVTLGQSPLYIYSNGAGGYGYGLALNFGVYGQSPYGPVGLGYIAPYNLTPSPYAMGYAPAYTPGYGYFSSGSSGSFDNMGVQQGLAAAQQAAGRMRKNQDEARELIDAQWAYEKLGVTGQFAAKGAKDQAEELQKALAVKDESEVASGAALNRILVAIVIAEAKGAKGVSAFVPPQMLEDVRFSGGPAADLLNVIRQSGKLTFPANFPGPTLEPLQAALETDFNAAVAPLRTGKSVDPAKVAKLEATLKKLDVASAPVIRDMSFEDAITARRFLNQLNSAVAELKSSNLSGLVNPKWSTDGTSAADLVKQMTKYKLMFAPAPSGSEASYFALHKTLATYLFVLSQAKK